MRYLIAALLAAGLSATALAATPAEQAAAVFADLKPGAPGCSAAAMQDGKVVWADGFGTADLATGRRNDTATLYNVASISKQFTAFAILQLEAAGKLSQDDSITKFFPELGAYAKPVTVRHLLHHTGGLRDYTFFALFAGIPISAKLTEQDGLAFVLKQDGPDFAPGSEWSYSNTGYFLLAVIVERVTGQTMADYAKANIFAPIGMTATSFVDRYPTALPALARGYSKDAAGKWAVDESGWEMTGDGQVHTNVRDLMLWEDNLATGRVGGKALVAKMQVDGVLGDGDPVHYGTGLALETYRGLRVVGHSGSWAGYNGDAIWFPEERFAAVVLCNAQGLGPSKRSRAMAGAWLGAKLAPEGQQPKPPIPPRLAAAATAPARSIVAGHYAAPSGALIEVVDDKGKLALQGYEKPVPLLPAGGEVLASELFDDPVYIAASAPGRIATSRDATIYTLIPPSPAGDLDRFVGAYGIANLPGTLTVVRQDKALVARIAGEDIALTPLAENRFEAGGYGLLTFAADGSSFTADAFARGVVFRRK